MRESQRESINNLVAWATENGLVLDANIEIYGDNITGLSIRTKPDVGYRADPSPSTPFIPLSCPVSITLSYVNALLNQPLSIAPTRLDGHTSVDEAYPAAPTFPAKFMESLPPHVIARFFLIHEYLRGKDSFWYLYIAALPQPDHFSTWVLPPFWPEEDSQLLLGTNLDAAIRDIRDRTKQEYRRARSLLRDAQFPAWRDYTRLLYHWAFCIFTSRSFLPSRIFSPSVTERVSGILPPGYTVDDFSVLIPILDLGNHDPSVQVEWVRDSAPWHCCLEYARRLEPGRQVFNNYGMKTNGELLLGYGFVIAPTPDLHNDYVHVQKRAAGADGAPGNRGKHQDQYLISLRPMNHASSVVGRSRQITQERVSLDVSPAFAHFQDSLVWDLAQAEMTDTERQTLRALVVSEEAKSSNHEAVVTKAACLWHLMSSSPHPGLASLVARLMHILLAKMEFEADVLEAIDSSATTGLADSQSANPRQQLAREYRGRCKQVLKAAIEAIRSVDECG